MNNWKQSRQVGDWLLLANGIVLVVLINLVASAFFFRIDLTEEKRYTIKEQTKKLLRDLDEDVYVEVFLGGDLNPGFRRFRKSVQETLEEFRIYSRSKVHYSFTDPASALSEKARSEFMAELAAKGVHGMRVIDSKGGERIEKIVFPGAVVSYNGFENGIMLLKGSRLAVGSQEVLNQSIEGVEFEIANAIQKLTSVTLRRIGLLRGNGELDSLAIAGLNNALLEQYAVFNVDLRRKKSVGNYDVLIIPKPIRPFTEVDKYKLDQYIMDGGKVIFLLDRLEANMDSASRQDYRAYPLDLNLDDQLFRYGVRINPDLVEDRMAGKYPVVVGEEGGKPQLMSMEWPWFPLINHYADHPITRNLDATLTRFVSSMDTVKATGVRKTPLLFTSAYAHIAAAPVSVSIQNVRQGGGQDFHEGPIPVAYLLEGEFASLYKNRFSPPGADTVGFLPQSKPTKIIIVADGDVARNDINPRTGQAQSLGFDPVSGYTFANQDVLLNMVAYLAEDTGLINARNKEVKIRPLDKERIKSERTGWQILNLALPVLVLIAFGLLRTWMRKKKYASF